MHIDAAADVAADLTRIEAAAAAAEQSGYDGFGIPEARHDVFTALTLAAKATSRITLQSAIAVAFARNPMSLAVCANDVQLVSRGRLRLGLGSQVQQHIERRYAMPWSHPAARMEEFIAAVRAIWSCWATGERLAFRGRFYQHTLMTDFFNPGPNPYGNPPIWLAAVGERMAAVAGRVADGILCHPFTTATYLREHTLPWVRNARGSLDGFDCVLSVMTVLGADEAARSQAERAVRRQIAFYGSTPAYRPVLELHGWGALHERLNALSRRQAWEEMADLIDDDVLNAFAVSGAPEAVAAALLERFGGAVTRLSLYTPYAVDPDLTARVVAALRSADVTSG
ncbi:MAG: TIGR03617 family F420-dependent LLM class oxidoreductase [Micromonosporaceae bacterium]|nr:TIGR03617 family F420-dependent LLM class oxidoreductase [Micromonosporaceae bacterium]